MEHQNRQNVILGKPMRKFKSSLISEDETKNEEINVNTTTEENKSISASPSKQIKTLLEESLDSKQNDPSVPQQVENIGVDKRLLLSVLASKKVENSKICGWTPFSYVDSIPLSQMEKIRKKYKIIVEGSNIPPLALKFKDMRLPECLCEYLEKIKKISDPSLIQMQGIPVALAGRDLIGIASTGSGKTLSFCIPLILSALEAEMKLPVLAGEGPFGIILAPSVTSFLYETCILFCFIERISQTNFPTGPRDL